MSSHGTLYIKSIVFLELFYYVSYDLMLKGFADKNWGACVDSRRSTTGFSMFVSDSIISLSSKKQPTNSRSSAGAENWALALAFCEMCCLTLFWSHYGLSIFTSFFSEITVVFTLLLICLSTSGLTI